MKHVAVAAVLALVAAACADAGPAPVKASNVSVSRRIDLGVTAHAAFTLRRGTVVVGDSAVSVIASKGGSRSVARAVGLGRGRYNALLRPTDIGRWSLAVRVRAKRLPLGSITVTRPRLVEPYKVIAEAGGALVVADGGGGGGRVIRVDPRTGDRIVIAGDGGRAFAAARGDATAASLGRVYSVARSPGGDLHLLVDNRILKLSRGRLELVAGTGGTASAGDGGPATRASLAESTDIEFAPDGDLFVAELDAGRVRRIEAGSGTISTVTRAVPRPFKLAFAHDGSLLVTQLEPGRVTKVDGNGAATTFLADVAVVSSIVPLPSGAYLLTQHPAEHGAAGDIVRVDADGTRTAIVQGTIREPTSLARTADGSVYVTTFTPTLSLGRVDLATGSVTPL